MTLIKRTNSLFPSIFDDFFSREWLGTEADIMNSKTLPAVNIKETEGSFEIELSSPGLDKKNFKIEVENDHLNIAYENKEVNEEKGDDGKYRRREFHYNSFQRSFTLPKTVNGDKIKAKYQDGVLKLDIPKKDEEKQKPSRLIDIS
ncbi:MAG: Hsp20/alpha crystallin family protein [Bacteroidota bacterium]